MSSPGRIVDAHHHLWDLKNYHYPRCSTRHGGAEADPLFRDYRIRDFRRDTGGLTVAGSVHVEGGHDPNDPVTETRWLERVSRRTGLPSVVVPYVALDAPDAGEVLDRHLDASSRVRGVRQMLDVDPRETNPSSPPRFFEGHAWRRGLTLVGERGLTFDLQVSLGQLNDAKELVQEHEDVTFVLNHGGFHTRGTSENWRAWHHGIQRLASLPNICAKASGFGSVEPKWTIRGLGRFLVTLIEAFGVERVLFASNFPVESRTISYREMIARYSQATEVLSASERRAFFFENAVRVYKIPISGVCNV